MPFIAIILDEIAAAVYVIQDQNRTQSMFVAGLIVQAVLALILLIMTFSYGGPRKQKRDYTLKGYRYLTVRFGIIIISLIINAVMVFLYVLNLKNGGSAVLFH